MLLQRQPQVETRFHKIRLHRQRQFVLRDGFSGAPECSKALPKGIVKVFEGAIKLHRPLNQGDRFFGVAILEQDNPEEMEGVGMRRYLGQNLAVNILCCASLPELMVL